MIQDCKIIRATFVLNTENEWIKHITHNDVIWSHNLKAHFHVEDTLDNLSEKHSLGWGGGHKTP